jgi:hypothetical protein
MLDTVVHKNLQLPEITVSDILDSDHLPILFNLLDHITTRTLSNRGDKFTDWEWFQRLSSELISPNIQINLREEAHKVACDFTASLTSAYNLSTCKLILSHLNKELPGLESLLKHERRLRKLWQAIWEPACKTAVNCHQNHQMNSL